MKTMQSLALRVRAVRMLTDGRRHAPAALKWAERTSHVLERRRVAELERAGFTLAEISLGAQKVHRG